MNQYDQSQRKTDTLLLMVLVLVWSKFDLTPSEKNDVIATSTEMNELIVEHQHIEAKEVYTILTKKKSEDDDNTTRIQSSLLLNLDAIEGEFHTEYGIRNLCFNNQLTEKMTDEDRIRALTNLPFFCQWMVQHHIDMLGL